MNITTLKEILNRKLGGASIDDIQGISDYSLFKEAASNLVGEISPAETIRYETLEVFREIYDYDPPTDLKELADVRPQTENRDITDNPTRRFLESFDQNKNNNDFTLEWRDAVKILRYSKDVGGKLSVHSMDSVTENGTWDGTATNIVADDYNPYAGSKSIMADFATGQYIENDDMTAVDLSDHENKSSLFVPAYFPDASIITSIGLLWGSSTSAYFSQTATTPQFGSFKNGWNLIPFAWNGATETGTVDTENINYSRITVNASSSDTDIKFNKVFSTIGQFRDLVYYSNYLFRSSSGTWLETPTDDTDLINLDTDAENIFVYECVKLAALGLQDKKDVYDTYTDELHGTAQKVGMYDRYKKRSPDEVIQPQTQRYRNLGFKKK